MKKSTPIALAVFALLAVVWVATRESTVQVGVRRLELAAVRPEALVSVELGPVTLQAADAGWTVAATATKEQAYPADSATVQSLTQALAELKAPDFVTERAERHAELEVDSAKGLTVVALTAEGPVRKLVLGKASKNGGAYLRWAGANEVFTTSGPLTWLARRGLKEWRDRRIPTVGSAEVSRVEVTPPAGAPFVLVKDGAAWKLEGATPADFRFDAEAAQRLVGQLGTLTAQDWSAGETDEALGFSTPPAVLVLGTGPGARTVRIGSRRADGTHALKIDGEAEVWLIAGATAETLRKDVEGLRDLRLLRFEAADVERVAVGTGATRAVVKKEGPAWKLVEPKTTPAGFEFDPAQVDAVLGRLQSLRASRVVSVPMGKAGLVAPVVELAVKGKGTTSLRFGAAAGEADEVFGTGSDGLLLSVPVGQKAWLDSGLELFKKQAPPPAPSAMQGLDQLPPEIRAQLEAQLRARQGR